MKYCENETLQKFVEKLVEELNMQSSISYTDIPSIIACISQSLDKNESTYVEFADDIEKQKYELHIIRDDRTFNVCEIKVIFDDFSYVINFSERFVSANYCMCTHNDKDYRSDKKCCGHDCDWYAPTFTLTKIFTISNHTWQGEQRNYWSFKDKFYAEQQELHKKLLQEERQNEIKEIEERIANDNKRLNDLLNESKIA